MNTLVAVGVVLAALCAGLLLAVAPILGVLIAVLCGVGVVWAKSGHWIGLAGTTVAVTILGIFTNLLNTSIVPADVMAYTTTIKWIPLLIAIGASLILSARVRGLVARPNNWAARFFLLFVLWTGIVLVMRAGLDADLLFKWASVFLIYAFAFGVIPAISDGEHDAAFVRALALVAGIVAVTSLATLVFATGDALSMGRLTGIAFNALTLAMFCTMGVLAFATLGFYSSGRLATLAYFAAAALCTGLLFLTGGRASVIALFLGLCTLVAGLFGQRRMQVALAVPAGIAAGVLLIVFSVQVFGIRLDQGLFREKGGESVRWTLIRDATQLLTDDPLTMAVGTGFGVVRKTYYAHLGIGQETDLTVSYSGTFAKLLHNSYLEILVETGVVGAALLLCSIGAGLIRMRRRIRAMPASLRVLGYGCLAIVVAAIIEAAFNSVLLAPGGALSMWLWPILGVYTTWQEPAPEPSFALAGEAA
jgi:hypothetical protein